jgi:hypothetical protein
MRKTILLPALMFLFAQSLFAQASLKEALKEIRSQGKYEAVVYLGADFSRVRINDEPKIPRSQNYSTVYPSAWITYMEKELPPNGIVKKSLGFKNFDYDQQRIFDISIAVSPDFIVNTDHTLSPEMLEAAVASYNLEGLSGLGFVMIPELFSKKEEQATTWIVFFDMQSRKILYKSRTYGKCSHMGYTAHWASGVVEGFKRFAHK